MEKWSSNFVGLSLHTDVLEFISGNQSKKWKIVDSVLINLQIYTQPYHHYYTQISYGSLHFFRTLSLPKKFTFKILLLSFRREGEVWVTLCECVYLYGMCLMECVWAWLCPCVFILCVSYVALKTSRTVFTGPFVFFNHPLSNQIVLWPLRHDQGHFFSIHLI